MKEFQIRDNEAGQRFDKYLSKLLRNAPKSFFYKMLRKKNITLNGKKATGNEKLEAGDQVKLFLSDETFDKFSQQDKAARAVTTLDVLYEDADVLLINKPAGMLSQPDDTKEPSMVEYVIGYLLEKGELTEEDLWTFRPSVCNRLDKNTSGIIAAGKSLVGLQELSELFHDRTVHKEYLCIVKGVLHEKKHIKGYLYKDTKQNKVAIYKQKQKEAQGLIGGNKTNAAGNSGKSRNVAGEAADNRNISQVGSQSNPPTLSDVFDKKTYYNPGKIISRLKQQLVKYEKMLGESEERLAELQMQQMDTALATDYEKLTELEQAIAAEQSNQESILDRLVETETELDEMQEKTV